MPSDRLRIRRKGESERVERLSITRQTHNKSCCCRHYNNTPSSLLHSILCPFCVRVFVRHGFGVWRGVRPLAAICAALTAVGTAFASFFGDETTAESCETVEGR